ncbi:MAG TPA: ABC transporter ATP-binding protein [Polyangiales bacterium]|nr:ABC transporter ATP-binding protein [Polyangiales bacterium]
MPAPPPSAQLTLKQYLLPHRARLAQGFVLLLLTNAVDKTIPIFLKDAVDALVGGQLSSVARTALIVAALALGLGVVRTLSRTRVFNVGRDVEYSLRRDLLQHLHRLGPSFFQRMSTGETMSRAINDLTQIRVMIGFGLLNTVNSCFAYVLALAYMSSMSPELTLWAILPFPLLVVFARVLGKRMFSRSQYAQEALGELSSRVQEALAGMRLTRVFGAEREQEQLFEEANQNALRKTMSLTVLRGFTWPLLIGVASAGTLLVLYRGTAMVREHTLTVGQLVAFLAYVESLKWPTMGLGYILAVLQRGRASFVRVRDILEAPPDVLDAPDAKSPKQGGELRVAELSYAYGERQVLDAVSFAVGQHGSLAIVGRTGSGKSTLAALLARILPTPSERVYLDGDDIAGLRLRELRKTVGYAQQTPFLFSDTIARNIGYSLPEITSPEARRRMRDAAEAAAVLDEIEELPDGWDTLVGERGVQLSGGQKQRIALARALLSEPRVLVMDDPLSAVDAKTEARILDSIEEAGKGRTVILVTHRVAAAQRCADILVLEGGRVIEHGSHAELLARDGAYADLAARQRLEQELSTL